VLNNGRLLQNCILAGCVSVRFADAILRNDDIYTRRRDLTFEFSVFTFQFVCGAGINFNTREMLGSPLHSDVTISRLNNHSAGIIFNTRDIL
jgi:hypothetical protein